MVEKQRNFAQKLSRRSFLLSCSLGLSSTISSKTAENRHGSLRLFGGAVRKGNGSFGVVVFDEHGNPMKSIDLPHRGHDITWDAPNLRGVSFSRRPGKHAVVFSADGSFPTRAFKSDPGRHFYGHGAFSPDGRFLFASENDFERSRGVIGVYSAGEVFAKVGELPSHGVGPHEIKMMPDGKTLAVANGGLETHPDYGRLPLNLDSMVSRLCLVDSRDGTLMERFALPPGLEKLSLRHLDISGEGQIFFGCQHQGALNENVPLIGDARPGKSLRFWRLPAELLSGFDNHVGSVKLSEDGRTLMATSPKGGTAALLSTSENAEPKPIRKPFVSGVARVGGKFFASTLENELASVDRFGAPNWKALDFKFENHLSAVTLST